MIAELIIGILIGFGARSLLQIFYNKKSQLNLQAIKQEWIKNNVKDTPTD